MSRESITWVVSEVFYPDEVATGYLITKIAEKIGETENVRVVCGPPAYEAHGTTASYTVNESLPIKRLWIPKLDKNRALSRAFRMSLISLRLAISILLKVRKKDKVIVSTNPAPLLVLSGWLKKLIGFNMIVIVHDVFPENVVASGMIKKDAFSYKLLLRIFNRAYSAANRLIVLGQDMRKLIEEKTGGNIPVNVIPNWSETEDIYPVPDISSSEYHQADLQGKIVIQYAGNIGRVQGLDTFIDAFKTANNPDLALVLIGEGALKGHLQKLIGEGELRNVYLFKGKPRKEQLQFLNACDIGLVTLSEGMYGLGVPSKTYNILAAGKAILYIGDEGSEVGGYVHQANNGWEFTWPEKDKLLEFLQHLKPDQLGEIREKGNRSRKLAMERFSKEQILEQYSTAISG